LVRTSYLLVLACTRDLDAHPYKRHVLNRDEPLFRWRDQHVPAIRLAAQDRGEQRHQRRPAYRLAFMKPAAIQIDADVDRPFDVRVPTVHRCRCPLRHVTGRQGIQPAYRIFQCHHASFTT
jgi:hypothetical protein